MREILFRGKDAESGEWVYGYYVHFETMHKVIYAIYTDCSDDYSGGLVAHCYDVNPETVGQYTGMTDKNGKKVFEGDILKGLYSNGNAEVKMINGSWAGYAGKGWTDIGYVVERVEVIGNIHDNPELLQD